MHRVQHLGLRLKVDILSITFFSYFAGAHNYPVYRFPGSHIFQLFRLLIWKVRRWTISDVRWRTMVGCGKWFKINSIPATYAILYSRGLASNFDQWVLIKKGSNLNLHVCHNIRSQNFIPKLFWLWFFFRRFSLFLQLYWTISKGSPKCSFLKNFACTCKYFTGTCGTSSNVDPGFNVQSRLLFYRKCYKIFLLLKIEKK